jgi:hypothetical protein
MAEVKRLEPPPALYDYVLFFECAQKDWANSKKKYSISGDGGLMSGINWNSTYSYDPDDAGGKTLFGVTESAWKEYVRTHKDKGYSNDLNTMGRQGWIDQISWFWHENSCAGECANYACAFLMFQMVWGGFTKTAQTNVLNKLKENADIKDYPFITSGRNYKKIADATHAFTDPMVAFSYMRSGLVSYYYNISTPDKTNKKYRVGWLNRAALPFTPYGLYIGVSVDGKSAGLKYESTLNDWDAAITRLVQNNTKGYVKIFDWGATPESIEKMMASGAFEYSPSSNSSSFSSTYSSSGAYGGCGGVYQLGNYSSAPDAQIIRQQSQNKEDVLNTLMSGSYTPNDVKKCAELATTEKKKNVKTKSES